MSADIEIGKLPGSPRSHALVLALVILVHAVGIWVWMTYGGLNKTPSLPPMMVVMDPPSKQDTAAKAAQSDSPKPADQTKIYLPVR